jgi:hypothetical protein
MAPMYQNLAYRQKGTVSTILGPVVIQFCFVRNSLCVHSVWHRQLSAMHRTHHTHSTPQYSAVRCAHNAHQLHQSLANSNIHHPTAESCSSPPPACHNLTTERRWQNEHSATTVTVHCLTSVSCSITLLTSELRHSWQLHCTFTYLLQNNDCGNISSICCSTSALICHCKRYKRCFEM